VKVANHSKPQNGAKKPHFWFMESQWAKEQGQGCGEEFF